MTIVVLARVDHRLERERSFVLAVFFDDHAETKATLKPPQWGVLATPRLASRTNRRFNCRSVAKPDRLTEPGASSISFEKINGDGVRQRTIRRAAN